MDLKLLDCAVVGPYGCNQCPKGYVKKANYEYLGLKTLYNHCVLNVTHHHHHNSTNSTNSTNATLAAIAI